jgi:hypothetical protein
MNCNEATSPVLVSPPLTERVVSEVFDALRSAGLAVAGLWKRRDAPALDERAIASIAHLNEHTLKDIGAPHWLVARAAQEREARHLRWVEFDVR